MLIGEFIQKIGKNKRVAIPSNMRKELGKKIFVTRGYEKSLIIVNLDQWEKITKEIQSGSIINNLVRDTSRILIGGAKQLNPDTQGRIVLPENLFEYAELNKSDEAVFVGLINWVEIHSLRNWKLRLNYLYQNGEKIADELNNQLLNQPKQ